MRGNWFILIVSICLTTITIVTLFWDLSSAPLERWDEQTNTAVISETLNHGTFPVLLLDNKPFFEKPPLWYFIQIGIARISGIHTFSLRSISAISGLCIVFLTVFFSWHMWGYISGITTWIVLLTSPQLYVTNPQGFFSTHTFRSADVDGLHIFFLVLSFLFSSATRTSQLGQYMTGVFAGFSVLTKNPLGLFPLIITTIIHRKNKFLHQTLLRNWIAALCITSPWYIWMAYSFKEDFISTFFGYHIQTRIFFSIEGHNNPWNYYFRLLGNPHIYPWSGVLIFSIIWTFIHPKLLRDTTIQSILFLLFSFFIIPTMMQTRLSWYILPVYPFSALLIGRIASAMLRKKR